jgi:hypothetical protein
MRKTAFSTTCEEDEYGFSAAAVETLTGTGAFKADAERNQPGCG